MRTPLSRRTLIRAGAGFGIGLPLLEAMMDGKAFAEGSAPKRYVLGFGGCALGSGNGTIDQTVVPSIIGANYDLKPGLAPLLPVKNKVTVVSGMKLPWAVNGVVPAGGMINMWHTFQLPGLLTGFRSTDTTRAVFAQPTTEHLAADFLGGAPLIKTLVTRAQAMSYYGGGNSQPGSGGVISYRRVNTTIQGVPPYYSPRQLFQTLFGNFTGGGTTPEQAAEQQWLVEQRRSVLDSVSSRMSRLEARLGSADKQRLDSHLQEFRELERRVSAIPPVASSACVKPQDPGPDPTYGTSNTFDPVRRIYVDSPSAYSGEDQRARVMADLIHMALVCDLTRSALFQLTGEQCGISSHFITGRADTFHALSHNTASGATLEQSKVVAWHMKHWAYLIGKLAASPEGGGSVLDNMAAVFTFEAGHGIAPSNGRLGPHSTENMVMLVSGGVGRLKQGHHLPAPGLHPIRVPLTALRALGFTGNTLGEISGEVPGLRV